MASYNLSANGQSVRVGNWFEELKLKEDTGIRFYAPPSAKNSSLLTKSRCIEHTDKVEPKEYTTVTRETLKDPRTYPVSSQSGAVGPKRRLLESTMRAQVEDELRRKAESEYKESRIVDYTTSGNQWYKQDGFRSSLRENDPNARIATHNASYSTDTAVTYYSHALKNPNERVSFPATFVGSTNPFSRHNAFSVDVAHNSLARRTETNERPRPVPTLQEYKTLTALRSKLLSEAQRVVGGARGATARYVTNALLQFEGDFLPLDEFKAHVASRFGGLSLTVMEERALASAYESVQELVLFLRPRPVRRRAELIEHLFSFMPLQDGEVAVVSADVSRMMMRGASSEVLAFLALVGECFTFEDFQEYFTDISAEIGDDYEYEDYVRNAWEKALNY